MAQSELSVDVKNSHTKEVETTRILHNVSGSAKPGVLLVIMGPSGAGKSSLLDCIAGRNHKVTGTITVNGLPWTKRIKRLPAYAMQDDLFYATITVREHLLFQARLRMGKTCTVEQSTTRVDTVKEELGLTKCHDTFIGGPLLRGISGGECERLSFATEILTNPSLLFWDEPSSGLDSYMADTVVLQLQHLAQESRTVVATIHQLHGVTVYHGKANEAVDYFAKLGFPCPGFVNPSDFFMRQLVVLDKEKDEAGVKRVQLLKDEWASKAHCLEGEATIGNVHTSNSAGDDSFEDTCLDPIGQMVVLMHRNFVRLVRDRLVFRVAIFQSVFLALIFGLINLQLDLDQNGVQNFAGAFFVIVVNQTFASASPFFVAIPNELPMILREYRSGLYRLIVWFISKNISELPVQILTPIVFFVPIYFLVGIRPRVGLGYMVSCIARRVEIAPIVGVITLMPFMLFGGLFLNSADVPKYFIWIQYISPIKYGFEAFMKIF